MSATIGINDLKFTIFASGHDYTLADSGDGDVQIFSHPFVPLNSVNYAGQYYFLVPDENGDPLDCVKDDIAHCEFTPALGTTFGTEGETTVEVHYHREYVYPEETVVVDKTVSQVIQVVNHGSVVDQTTNLDVYSDGYGFIRPQNVNTVEVKDYVITGKNAVTKLSSFPWRATGLGAGQIYGFFGSMNLTDISELAFADVSKCTKFYSVFDGDNNLTDYSPIAEWDVSNVTVIYRLGGQGMTSLVPLTKWNTSKCTNLMRAFAGYRGTSLQGLENWDVSNVTDMNSIFDGAFNLNDISALAKWKTVKNTTLYYAFYNTRIKNLNALAEWDVSKLTSLESAFENCDKLTDVSALSHWGQNIIYTLKNAFKSCTALQYLNFDGFDVSHVTNFLSAFSYCTKLLSLDGMENWDVSNGQNFYQMFEHCGWLSDISALENWDMSNATEMSQMFQNCNSITSMDDLANWRPTTSYIGGMFHSNYLCYSSLLGMWLLETSFYYFDYDGNGYSNIGVQDADHPLQYPTYDADKASLWGVSGSNMDVFDNKWINKPSWN